MKRQHETPKKMNIRKAILPLILFLVCVCPGVMAGESNPPSFSDDPFSSPMILTYTVGAFVVLTLLLLLLTAFYMLRVVNVLLNEQAKERARKAGVAFVPEPSVWDKFWQRINASVPVAQEADIDTGHSYDGIRELDNHLPPWWTGLFYGTIMWSVVYLLVYHVTASMPLSIDEYQSEVTAADEKARQLKAAQPAEAIDVEKLAYTADAALISKGKAVFTMNNCGSCHRNDGGGNTIGPNLTDAYWLHGGGIKNIFTTINNGVVEKGMPAWGKAMSQASVRDVAFYVMSLQGSNPANAKAPQGSLYVPEKEPVKTDTTKTTASPAK